MRRHHITLGAMTTAGGKVITASSSMSVHGQNMALEGDQIACPACRAVGKIVCIGPRNEETWHGKAVALENDLCICACPSPPKLKPNQQDRYQDLRSTSKESRESHSASAPAPDRLIEFDEQIAFLLERRTPIAEIPYRLVMEDGSTAEGTTDAHGRTARIVTNTPMRVMTAELFVPALQAPCCSPAPNTAQHVAMSFHLTATATNGQNVGSSVARVSVQPSTRQLTAEEMQMARLLFRDAIDYGKVRVHNRGFFWLNLQSKSTAVTPNGEIYFNEEDFRADYSKEQPEQVHWFVHEMVHVWQYQLGYPVMLRGAVRPGLQYQYELHSGTSISDYDMEAQANLLADYFVLQFLKKPDVMVQRQYRYSSSLYVEVLSDFFMDRASKNNLPGGAGREPRRSDYDN